MAAKTTELMRLEQACRSAEAGAAVSCDAAVAAARADLRQAQEAKIYPYRVAEVASVIAGISLMLFLIAWLKGRSAVVSETS